MTSEECARIEELISAMQDSAATPEEVARVERHTAGCARCRATGAAYQRVDQQVRRYIMATPVPEIAAPWRNEPLVVPTRPGAGGIGHWRITLAGLATIFVLLLGATVLTFRPFGISPGRPEAVATEHAQFAASNPVSATAVAPAAGLPTAAAAIAPAAPAGGGSGPAGAAPAASAAPNAGAAGGAAPTPAGARSAASAAPASAPAPSAAASSIPAASAAPRPSTAPAAAPPAAGTAATPPVATPRPAAIDGATINPAQAFGLAGATSLTICRPDCDAQAQEAEVLRRVVAALDRQLAPAFVPPSTVPIPYVTLRFRLANGQQLDIGYYLQVNILQLPENRGTFAAPPELIAALAGSLPAR